MKPARSIDHNESAADSSIQLLRHELSAVRAALRVVYRELEEANVKIDLLRMDLDKHKAYASTSTSTMHPEPHLMNGCDDATSRRILDQLRSDVARMVDVEIKSLRAENQGAEQHLEMFITKIEKAQIPLKGASSSHKDPCGSEPPFHPLEEVTPDMQPASYSAQSVQLQSQKARIDAVEDEVSLLKVAVTRLFYGGPAPTKNIVKHGTNSSTTLSTGL